MSVDLPVPPRIYVAASSKEIPRALRVMQLVRELGGVVHGEWTESILRAGDSEGTRQTDAERALLSAGQLAYVTQSDALVLLVPEVEKTIGAWAEAGTAFGRIPVVASCVAPRLPWALAWAHLERTDEAAVRRALRLAIEPSHPLARSAFR